MTVIWGIIPAPTVDLGMSFFIFNGQARFVIELKWSASLSGTSSTGESFELSSETFHLCSSSSVRVDFNFFEFFHLTSCLTKIV